MPGPMTADQLRERTLQSSRQGSLRGGVGGVAIAPSLLACDFARLADEIAAIEAAGATVLHLDIMDGHFVPNLSFGVPVVEAIRRCTELPLDVHLMLDNPGEYVEPFRKAGADVLTVHAEVLPDPRPLLDEIRNLGAAAGLSLNPPMPVAKIEPFVGDCDLILVMSVEPGFGGQAFDPSALEKLSWLRDHPQCDAILEVDGGVNADTIAGCAEAGAELLVAGTAVFGADDYTTRLAELTQLASAAWSAS
ncbi:Ribulose-phosphate 3-epimerase [Planctomycetes bacterium MalM25]|nr:Ribulose-phosphate 3-epimerase [Planctomycetes bacterium MalM25]